jgi:hypothetical protein
MPTLKARAVATVSLIAVSWCSTLIATPTTDTTMEITAILTVDNHYGLYYGTPAGVTFVGRNEFDAAGDPFVVPYTNNWSLPETFTFSVKPGNYIYVAAWSDDGAAQGFMGQLTINGHVVVTKASGWEVAFTGINLGDFSLAPTEAELVAQLAAASWHPVAYSLPQGSQPWATYQPGGLIPGIGVDADWIWGTPLTSDFEQTAATEYHIYRYRVPPLGVAIKIKPGSDTASINLGSAGVIPVAILSSATFDASQVNPASVSLAGARVNLIGKAGRYSCSSQDVNSDGRADLVCHVETAAFLLEPGESTAMLEGETYDGASIRGQEIIRIVP